MGISLESRHLRREPPRPDGIRFVPAGWLVAAVGVSRLLIRGGTLGKLSVAGLIWSVTPRKLKLVAAGLALSGLIVLAGAMAALALLAIELV
jgi:hypothetical protein